MTEPKRYRRRPETVEAIQYDGSEESRNEILLYFPDGVTLTERGKLIIADPTDGRQIDTGDYVVRYDDRRIRLYDETDFEELFDPLVPVRLEPDCGCCD